MPKQQTESIAGIRDARFQEMVLALLHASMHVLTRLVIQMPDVLLWLGIERIDWLLSMSSYDFLSLASIDTRTVQ